MTFDSKEQDVNEGDPVLLSTKGSQILNTITAQLVRRPLAVVLLYRAALGLGNIYMGTIVILHHRAR